MVKSRMSSGKIKKRTLCAIIFLGLIALLFGSRMRFYRIYDYKWVTHQIDRAEIFVRLDGTERDYRKGVLQRADISNPYSLLVSFDFKDASIKMVHINELQLIDNAQGKTVFRIGDPTSDKILEARHYGGKNTTCTIDGINLPYSTYRLIIKYTVEKEESSFTDQTELLLETDYSEHWSNDIIDAMWSV